MIKYPLTVLALSRELWAVDRGKLSDMVDFILFKAEGGKLSALEIDAAISNQRAREVATQPGNVGIIPIHGLIMPRIANLKVSEPGVGLDATAAHFRAAIADTNIKAIVMEFDTPGGNTAGLDEFALEVFEARGVKPIVAQINSLAASAGYYIASQADEIVASPSSRAGSIGVYSIHDDISEALRMKGINRTVIASGENKTTGSPFGPLTDEARDKIARAVNYANDQFVKAVARGRNVSQKFVNENMGQGDVFDPPDLIKRGMADRIAPMKDTLARYGVEVSPAKRTQSSAARAALALGRYPARSDFEAMLRECGASKSMAASLASGAADPGRSESVAVPERSESVAESGVTKQTLAEVREGLATLMKTIKKEG